MSDVPLHHRTQLPPGFAGEAKPPYALADTSGQQRFGQTVFHFSGAIFDKIVRTRAANEEAEFHGLANTEIEKVRTYVAANPNLPFEEYEKKINEAMANIQSAAGKATTGLAKEENARWMDANLDAISQRMLTDAEAELSGQEWRRAEAQRKVFIAGLDAEGLINHSQKMIEAGTYDAETEKARLSLDLARIQTGQSEAAKEALWNIATQQATDEHGMVNWSEVLSFLNQPKNTQGVSSGDVDSLIENAETQLRIQTAKTDPEVYWSVLRRINNDPQSVPEEELAFLVNKGKLTTDDYKEFTKIKETKGHPLKSVRAQMYFGELDKLYKDGAIENLEQYDVKNEKLTEFFESNPDASAKDTAEFFDELIGQEKSHWVWNLLNYYPSTAGIGFRLGRAVFARRLPWRYSTAGLVYEAAKRIGGGSQETLPQPTTEAEYNALPAGTRYIHPEHGERIKR